MKPGSKNFNIVSLDGLRSYKEENRRGSYEKNPGGEPGFGKFYSGQASLLTLHEPLATAVGGAAVVAAVAVSVADGDGAADIADGGVGLEVGELAVEVLHDPAVFIGFGFGFGFVDDVD